MKTINMITPGAPTVAEQPIGKIKAQDLKLTPEQVDALIRQKQKQK